MKHLAIVSTLVVWGYGLPEPPAVYQYSSPEQSPFSSYSAPLASVGPLPSYSLGNGAQVLFSSEETFPSGESSDHSRSANAVLSSSSATPTPLDDFSFNDLPFSNDHIPTGGIVSKHIYINLPPTELELNHQKKTHVKVPAPQKHYKVIFIKAPSLPVSTAEIPRLQRVEEKTLIYVLVKKPEEEPVIKIPKPVPTQPSKPQVYFIKYKAQIGESKGHGHRGGRYGVPSSVDRVK